MPPAQPEGVGALSDFGPGQQQGRKDLNPVHPGWGRRPLPGGRPCSGDWRPRSSVIGGLDGVDHASASVGPSGRKVRQLGTPA